MAYHPLLCLIERIFTSKLWRELHKLSGTKLKYSSAYHPEKNGQSEVVNRVSEMHLRSYCNIPQYQRGSFAICWYAIWRITILEEFFCNLSVCYFENNNLYGSFAN